MSAHPDPTAMLASYIEVKRGVCRRDNGPSDAVPILHVKPLATAPVVIGMKGEGHPPDDIPMVLITARAMYGELEWVAFLCDSYVKVEGYAGPPPPDHDIPRGTFEHEYRTEPDGGGVRETLALTWLAADGTKGYAHATYSYPDGPEPKFDPVVHIPDGLRSGNIPRALEVAFA